MRKMLLITVLSGIAIVLSAAGDADACFSKFMSPEDKKWDDFYVQLEEDLAEKVHGRSCSVLNIPWQSIIENAGKNLSLRDRLEGIRKGRTVSVTLEEYTKSNCQGTFCPFRHCGVYFFVKKKRVQVKLLETKPIDRAPTVLHKEKTVFHAKLPL